MLSEYEHEHEPVALRAHRRPDTRLRPLPPAPRPARPRTDAELLAHIATGDRQALAVLYRRHARTLRRLAQKRLGRTDAEDLLHDVMLEVWQKAHSYDPTRGPVRAWLALRLRSRALDRLRAARRTCRADLSELDAAFEAERLATGDDPGRRYLQLRVRRACAGLAPAERALLADTYALGLTGAEVADRLAVPLGTVKSRLGRTLRRVGDAVCP